MKRAMGLVLAVLLFALVAHADRVGFASSETVERMVNSSRSQEPSIELLGSRDLFAAPAIPAIGEAGSFGGFDDSVRFRDDTFCLHFDGTEIAAENSPEFDSLRRWLGGFVDTTGEGRDGSRWGVPTDPFRRFLAVTEVPEPAMLPLLLAGLVALAIWKRRSESVC